MYPSSYGSIMFCNNGIFLLQKGKQHFSHNLKNQEYAGKYIALMSKSRPSPDFKPRLPAAALTKALKVLAVPTLRVFQLLCLHFHPIPIHPPDGCYHQSYFRHHKSGQIIFPLKSLLAFHCLLYEV